MGTAALLAKPIELQVIQIDVKHEQDINRVTHKTYDLAHHVGFNRVQRTMIATAASELANNIICHAQQGVMALKQIYSDEMAGIELLATDSGPGIANIQLALKDGYSTGGSLGLGLPGAKRLMHEFHFNQQRLSGTEITLRRWL